MANHFKQPLLTFLLLSIVIRVLGMEPIAHVKYSSLNADHVVSFNAILSDVESQDGLFWLDEEDTNFDSFLETEYHSWPPPFFLPSRISIEVFQSSRFSRRYILYCALKLDC
jgi:hypothetical protein